MTARFAATLMLLGFLAAQDAAAEAGRGADCKLLPASAGARLAICRGKIRPDKPAFNFVFIGRRVGADRRIATAIAIERLKAKRAIQTLTRPGWDIEVPAAGGKGATEEKGALDFDGLPALGFVLADINFDGHADIRVFAAATRGCVSNHYWLFDTVKARYGPKRDEETLAIAGLQCGDLRFDAKRKEIHDRRQAMRYHMVTVETVYRWRGPRLERARTQVEVIAKSGRCRARLYRFVGGKPRRVGYRACPRDTDGGNKYSPPDRDLAKAKTFDQWIK